MIIHINNAILRSGIIPPLIQFIALPSRKLKQGRGGREKIPVPNPPYKYQHRKHKSRKRLRSSISVPEPGPGYMKKMKIVQDAKPRSPYPPSTTSYDSYGW